MKTSKAGLALIKEHEGLRLESYLCPAKVWTIGYGHTSAAGVPVVTRGMRISSARAEEILINDLSNFEGVITRLVKVPLTQNQFDALVSFVFNLGESNFRKSTLLKQLNKGHYADVPAQLMRWTKAGGRELPGLVRRRRDEAKLWRAVDDTAVAPPRTVPDEPPVKPVTKSREANGAIAAGGISLVTAMSEAMPVVRSGTDIIPSLTEALGRPAVIAALAVTIICIAIWFWRRQRLSQEGV